MYYLVVNNSVPFITFLLNYFYTILEFEFIIVKKSCQYKKWILDLKLLPQVINIFKIVKNLTNYVLFKLTFKLRVV